MAGLRTRSADTARATPALPHVRPGARNARAPSLHEADEDEGIRCPTVVPVGAGHERDHDRAATPVLPQRDAVQSSVAPRDQASAGDIQ